MTHQCTGVDVGQHGHFELLKIFFRNLLRAPVGADLRELADDQSLYIGTRRLVVFNVGAVISDLRIGKNDDLSGVGRIGENFLIAGDGSIKNYFARKTLPSSRARIACILTPWGGFYRF
jgi:hypothetical protein